WIVGAVTPCDVSFKVGRLCLSWAGQFVVECECCTFAGSCFASWGFAGRVVGAAVFTLHGADGGPVGVEYLDGLGVDEDVDVGALVFDADADQAPVGAHGSVLGDTAGCESCLVLWRCGCLLGVGGMRSCLPWVCG